MQEQHDHSPRIPERHLLVAILRRALFDYVQGSGEEKVAARDWLFDEDQHTLFSFRWICTQLEIDAGSILFRLKRRGGRKVQPLTLAA